MERERSKREGSKREREREKRDRAGEREQELTDRKREQKKLMWEEHIVNIYDEGHISINSVRNA